MKCQICSCELTNKVATWSFYCPRCDYWAANFNPNVSDTSDVLFDEKRDDEGIITFLNSIRVKNFNKILNLLINTIGINKEILDVGCASGLFVEMANSMGYRVTGVEPNPAMYNSAIRRNLDVTFGYFPDSLNPLKKYDVIIFNDVFEHIPDINSILKSCVKFLNNDGILILNVPNSNGLIFKISKMLAFFGFSSPWNRLWQTMFLYSPHLHYFNASSLSLLVGKYKFKILKKQYELDSISINGLWERISIDRSNKTVLRLAIYFFIIAFYPLIKILPKDNFFAVYKK